MPSSSQVESIRKELEFAREELVALEHDRSRIRTPVAAPVSAISAIQRESRSGLNAVAQVPEIVDRQPTAVHAFLTSQNGDETAVARARLNSPTREVQQLSASARIESTRSIKIEDSPSARRLREMLASSAEPIVEENGDKLSPTGVITHARPVHVTDQSVQQPLGSSSTAGATVHGNLEVLGLKQTAFRMELSGGHMIGASYSMQLGMPDARSALPMAVEPRGTAVPPALESDGGVVVGVHGSSVATGGDTAGERVARRVLALSDELNRSKQRAADADDINATLSREVCGLAYIT